MKRLFRSTSDRKLAGVCSGVARYLDVDPTVVRLATALLSLCYGAGIIAYIVAWIVVPEAPAEAEPVNGTR